MCLAVLGAKAKDQALHSASPPPAQVAHLVSRPSRSIYSSFTLWFLVAPAVSLPKTRDADLSKAASHRRIVADPTRLVTTTRFFPDNRRPTTNLNRLCVADFPGAYTSTAQSPTENRTEESKTKDTNVAKKEREPRETQTGQPTGTDQPHSVGHHGWYPCRGEQRLHLLTTTLCSTRADICGTRRKLSI